jgi:hypothetical protein
MSNNRQGGAEIEVTPQMIEVGTEIVRGHDPDWITPRQTAQEVYLAMERVRLRDLHKQS